MKKENLVIIAGMPRAGTSYLYQTLDQHPEVYVPIIKETNYFIYNNKKGLPWFEKLYEKAGSGQKIFDISPFYFLDDDFFENVDSFNISQKVILILRDPNEWVKSFYKQVEKQAYGLKNFEQFVDDYRIRFEDKEYNINFRTFDYIQKVENFRNTFKENLLLIDFDEFELDKVKVLHQIEDFIGVGHFFSTENIINDRINAGDVKSNKLITYLSTIKVLREAAFKVLPNNLIHYIRNKFILGVATEKSDRLPNIYQRNNVFKKYFSL